VTGNFYMLDFPLNGGGRILVNCEHLECIIKSDEITIMRVGGAKYYVDMKYDDLVKKLNEQRWSS